MTERTIALGATKRILLLGALAGSLAGLMMAGVEMIYGWAGFRKSCPIVLSPVSCLSAFW